MTQEVQAQAKQRQSLSIVVPCYNESDVIGLFYREVRQVLDALEAQDSIDCELVFADDGSSDDTLDQLNKIAEQDPAVRICSLSRNFGHQIALTAGLDAAAGDAVVMMDADLQHPPSLIPEMVRRWRAGTDIVLGIRKRTEGASWFKNLTSSGFYTVLNLLSTTKVPQGAADFCLLSRRVVESLHSMPERHRFLRGLISWAGFSRVALPYESPRRAAGHTKYSPVKMFTLALDAVFSFSAEPLRLAWRAGLTIAVLGFIYLAWNIIKGFLLNALVPGYASVIGLVMLLGGAQLVFIGLIGEYLARVFEQVKGRPLYFLKQEPRDPKWPKSPAP